MPSFGFIGAADADQALVEAALTDLWNSIEFQPSVTIGVPDENPDVYTVVLNWCIENEIDYTLYTAKGVELDAEFTDDQKLCIANTSVPDPSAKVLAWLLKEEVEEGEEDGKRLFVFISEDGAPDAVQSAAQKAAEAGINCYDLSEGGMDLIEFEEAAPEETKSKSKAKAKPAQEPEPENEDEEAVTPEDLRLLGESADGGDGDDIATLTSFAEECTLDPDDFATWAELAEAIITQLGEDEPAEAETEAAPAEAWTKETLPSSVKDLRLIAKQTGIEGFEKMSRTDLVAAILGEAPAEEKPASATKAKATPKADAAEVKYVEAESAAATYTSSTPYSITMATPSATVQGISVSADVLLGLELLGRIGRAMKEESK